MSRFPASLGVLAVSALFAAAALADTTQPPQQPTLTQNLDVGIRDAHAKREAHDYAGAIRVLSQLMLVAPDDPRVVGEYGKVLIQQGRAREALDFLGRAVQLQQGDWTLFSALGVAYDQAGDYDNARRAYERALALKPGESTVLNNYAMSRVQAGDLPEARRLIAMAAAGAKDDTIARNQKLIAGLAPPSVAAQAHTPRPVPAAAPAKAVAASGLPPAHKPPRPLVQPAPQTAASVTKLAGGTVMMQAVPEDPKAGPVGKPHKVAKAAKPAEKPAEKLADSGGIPALRLANDRP